ncbi:hypothetical protein BV25DRAFT_1900274 [Artomyces pyxidatus]|uniref:Uncharacterized protein n=1 Tax=Artomyces pyxidatus TaxID=48021 RepID=A0ACB8SZU9_9AGAM|nr:hypothetical protein BV25DRAFT_1900274 [Artomyces pyxidatus]
MTVVCIDMTSSAYIELLSQSEAVICFFCSPWDRWSPKMKHIFAQMSTDPIHEDVTFHQVYTDRVGGICREYDVDQKTSTLVAFVRGTLAGRILIRDASPLQLRLFLEFMNPRTWSELRPDSTFDRLTKFLKNRRKRNSETGARRTPFNDIHMECYSDLIREQLREKNDILRVEHALRLIKYVKPLT